MRDDQEQENPRQDNPELDESLLQELLLGTLDPSAPEIRARLDASPATAEEWSRVRFTQARLDDLGEEDRRLLAEIEGTRPSVADRELVADWLSGTQRHRRLFLQVAAAAGFMGLVVLARELTTPRGEAPIGLMGFEDDRGLRLRIEEHADGRIELFWEHEPSAALQPWTSYHIECFGETGHALPVSIDVVSKTSKVVDIDPDWREKLTWRVVARDAEGVEYAWGNTILDKSP